MPEYSALMPFVGGCRETAPASFSLLAEAFDPVHWPSSLLIDGFFGGGAISVTAKQCGFAVIANDLAERSAIAAMAIMQSERPQIDARALAERLLRPIPITQPELDALAENTRDYMDIRVATTCAVAFRNARSLQAEVDVPTQCVAMYAALLLTLSAKPGMYWTRLTEKTREAQLHKFGADIDTVMDKLVRRIEAVVKGITPSEHRHRVYCDDAISVLQRYGSEAHVASIDPPTYGNDVYLRNYFVADAFINDTVWQRRLEPPHAHVWHKQDAIDFYTRVCEASAPIPFWLVRDDAVLFGKGELAEWLEHKFGRHILQREVPRSGGHTSQLIVAAAEPIKHTGRKLVLSVTKRVSEPPKTKAESIRRQLSYLKRHEMRALSFCRQPDWDDLRPRLVRVRGPELTGVWNYYRHVISSEPQKPAITGIGRWSPWCVLDENTGAMLGIFGLTDDNSSMAVRDHVIGWSRERAEAQIHRVVFLARCLPMQPFGQLLGGKLLALLATSMEVIRDWELTYSYTVCALSVRTLHGESSQYNGLSGFQFLGEDEQGRGHYLVELRKRGLRALRGELDVEQTRNAKRYATDLIEEWRERWYLPRLARVRSGEVKVDERVNPKDYTLARWL